MDVSQSMMKAMQVMQEKLTDGGGSSHSRGEKLSPFDGEESKWYSWKESTLSKLNLDNCKPFSAEEQLGGKTPLGEALSRRLYDHLNNAVKDTASICKRLGKQSKGDGQVC